MYEIRLEKEYFNFCAAHFVIFGEKDRELLHGHNYYLSIVLQGETLNNGKLIDISILKPKIRSLCDEIDHKFILPLKNPYLRVTENQHSYIITHNEQDFSFPKGDVYPINENNSTMENLCHIFIDRIINIIGEEKSEIEEIIVTIEESKGQKASKSKKVD